MSGPSARVRLTFRLLLYKNDSVTIYNGKDATGRVLRKFSHNNAIGNKLLIESTTNDMYIVYHTDSLQPGWGINANFQRRGKENSIQSKSLVVCILCMKLKFFFSTYCYYLL